MGVRENITIRDVAARAGVSHQTVSRVINNSERVSPETRAKVEAAIAALDYRPNAIARIMATGSTSTLACISPNLTDFTFSNLIEGAQFEARQRGYLLIATSAPDARAFTHQVEQLISSRRTEGLLVINPYADERNTLVPQNVATVFIGARPRSSMISSVSLDDEAVGHTATQYLLSLGHVKIAQITGPHPEDCTQDRCTGYQSAITEAGLVVEEKLTTHGDWSVDSGYQEACNLLRHGGSFSAIFAQNDLMAIGAIRAIREVGLRVPQDISVIGIDDIPLAPYFNPPLTTIHQDIFNIGQQAARILIQAVEYPNLPTCHIRIPANLIVRESTAPLIFNR